MRSLFLRGLGLAALALAAMPASVVAQGPGCATGAPCCAPPCPMQEVEVTVNVRVPRRVPTCECEKKRYWTADVVLEDRTIWVDAEIVRDVVKQVPTSKLVPITIKDPCTGCIKTEYQQQTCVEQVVSKVIETIPVKKTYKVYAVKNWVVDERVVPKTCLVYDCVPQKVTTRVPCGAAVPAVVLPPSGATPTKPEVLDKPKTEKDEKKPEKDEKKPEKDEK